VAGGEEELNELPTKQKHEDGGEEGENDDEEEEEDDDDEDDVEILGVSECGKRKEEVLGLKVN
jgi:hypothetical protein